MAQKQVTKITPTPVKADEEEEARRLFLVARLKELKEQQEVDAVNTLVTSTVGNPEESTVGISVMVEEQKLSEGEVTEEKSPDSNSADDCTTPGTKWGDLLAEDHLRAEEVLNSPSVPEPAVGVTGRMTPPTPRDSSRERLVSNNDKVVICTIHIPKCAYSYNLLLHLVDGTSYTLPTYAPLHYSSL